MKLITRIARLLDQLSFYGAWIGVFGIGFGFLLFCLWLLPYLDIRSPDKFFTFTMQQIRAGFLVSHYLLLGGGLSLAVAYLLHRSAQGIRRNFL